MASCKNHFVGRLCVDKLAHTLASGLHIGGGFLREAVYAAVNVGFGVVVYVFYSLDHAFGCLCRCCVVEIDHGLPIYLTVENGKVVPVFERVERGHSSGSVWHAVAQVSQLPDAPDRRRSTSRCMRCLSTSNEIWSMMSLMKVWVSIRRASSAGMPRVCM